MKDTKQQWFKEAKFGLFIHWGLYSLLAGEYKGKKTDHIAEWIMNYLNIPVEEYEKLAEQFDPVNFDADALVKQAKDWGMRYIVFTSKHHEGFAMFHSQCSPYNVVDATPCKRDILKELQLACEKYDMKLGLYYSQAQDWHDPDGYVAKKDNSQKDYRAYLDRKCMPQLKEILTNYGEIALIWFDTPLATTAEESKEMAKLVKELQPNCIISGRIGNGLGEYMTTGDNFIPRLPFEGDWEVPATLNDTWGFNKDDHNWKNADEIIQLLIKINSRGGNYLLNIGPDGTGRVPAESIEILTKVGKYVKTNEEAIFATKRVPVNPYELTWGELTCKDYHLYAHVFRKVPRVEILNINNEVKRAYLLENGQELEFIVGRTCEGDGFINIELPPEYKEKTYYCIGIELQEKTPVFHGIQE